MVVACWYITNIIMLASVIFAALLTYIVAFNTMLLRDLHQGSVLKSMRNECYWASYSWLVFAAAYLIRVLVIHLFGFPVVT